MALSEQLMDLHCIIASQNPQSTGASVVEVLVSRGVFAMIHVSNETD